MISTGTNRIVLSATLAGIVIMATACTLHTQTRQPPEVKGGTTPSSSTTPSGVSTNRTTGGATKDGTTTGGRSTGISTPELVPMSAPPPSEPQATTTRPPNDADDPRAVIDWLLDRSSRGR